MKADVTITAREMVELLRSALIAKTGIQVGNIFVMEQAPSEMTPSQILSITRYQQTVSSAVVCNLLLTGSGTRQWSEA